MRRVLRVGHVEVLLPQRFDDVEAKVRGDRPGLLLCQVGAVGTLGTARQNVERAAPVHAEAGVVVVEEPLALVAAEHDDHVGIGLTEALLQLVQTFLDAASFPPKVSMLMCAIPGSASASSSSYVTRLPSGILVSSRLRTSRSPADFQPSADALMRGL